MQHHDRERALPEPDVGDGDGHVVAAHRAALVQHGDEHGRPQQPEDDVGDEPGECRCR
jgi:hypothetical protein